MERTSTNKKKRKREQETSIERTAKEKCSSTWVPVCFFLSCQVHVPNNDAIIKYIDFRVIVLTDGVHCQ